MTTSRRLYDTLGAIRGETNFYQPQIPDTILPVALIDDTSRTVRGFSPRLIGTAVPPVNVAGFSGCILSPFVDGEGLWLHRLRMESGNGSFFIATDYDGVLATYFLSAAADFFFAQANGGYQRGASTDSTSAVARWLKAVQGYGNVLNANSVFMASGIEMIPAGRPLYLPPGGVIVVQANVLNSARAIYFDLELALPIGSAENIAGLPLWK